MINVKRHLHRVLFLAAGNIQCVTLTANSLYHFKDKKDYWFRITEIQHGIFASMKLRHDSVVKFIQGLFSAPLTFSTFRSEQLCSQLDHLCDSKLP